MTREHLPSTAFILYGATGDLAKRLVLPGFWELAQSGLLTSEWRLIGNGRGDVSHEEFRDKVKAALDEFGSRPTGKEWDEFAERCFFAGGGFDKDNAGTLPDVLKTATDGLDDVQVIHYFAVPPTNFAKLTEGVQAHGMVEGSKVVYEKPYGTSPETFKELESLVGSVFTEDQVYRIDHFLGKEATQNLHVMRFANMIFDNAWSAKNVESVQIDVPETLDVTDRVAFYESTGAFLDMIVTHLFQLAAEVAMEPPADFTPENLQKARESVLGSFRPLVPEDVVLGQFNGYQDIEGVAEDSKTDTYVAAKLWIDNERWRGVPFLLRTGKRLAATHQRVNIIFKAPKIDLDVPAQGSVLTFVLSGTGAIEFSAVVKTPGVELKPEKVTFARDLESVGGLSLKPYGRLLHDVLAGNRSLFTSPEGLSHAWKTVDPILQNRPEPISYAPDSWGPKEGSELAGLNGWLLGE